MPGNSPESAPQSLAHVASNFAAITAVSVRDPFRWLAMGLADLRAAPAASLFYGAAFALMGWAIVFFYGHAYSLTVGLMGGFMLLGPGLAMGLYALSRQREAGEVPRLRPSLTIWRANLSNLAIFALVTGVVFLVWARASPRRSAAAVRGATEHSRQRRTRYWCYHRAVSSILRLSAFPLVLR